MNRLTSVFLVGKPFSQRNRLPKFSTDSVWSSFLERTCKIWKMSPKKFIMKTTEQSAYLERNKERLHLGDP